MTVGTFLTSIKSKVIEDFITDVANTSTSYFITFGRSSPWNDELYPPIANTNVASSIYDVDREILYGKQINETNIAYMINNIPWTANKIYNQYDDLDPDIYSKPFYVINNNKQVYKCLFNNYASPSTDQPISISTNADFVGADGYKWKYMFTIDSATYNKFASTGYIPIQIDTNVTAGATSGAIHTALVLNAGRNYPHANGQIVARTATRIAQIATNGSDGVAGLYQDSSLYITSGTTGAAYISRISQYVVNAAGRFVYTSDDLPSITASATYKIGPTVVINGDGLNAKAFAYVEPTANSIINIDVPNQGSGYTYATASIVANSIALGTGGGGTTRLIISPPGGHGADVKSELGCEVAGISLEVNPTDNFPEWIAFRQISLIYNPIAVSNNTIFNDPTFTQYTTLGIGLYSGTYDSPLNNGGTNTIIKGLSTGATAEVIYNDTNNIYVKNVVGQFQNFETVIERDKPKFPTTISYINTGQLIPYSGKTFYYKNVEAITRYTGSRETVKIYFKI
jgi:hypothetical protein